MDLLLHAEGYFGCVHPSLLQVCGESQAVSQSGEQCQHCSPAGGHGTAVEILVCHGMHTSQRSAWQLLVTALARWMDDCAAPCHSAAWAHRASTARSDAAAPAQALREQESLDSAKRRSLGPASSSGRAEAISYSLWSYDWCDCSALMQVMRCSGVPLHCELAAAHTLHAGTML